jgi:hypothetical protein
MLGLSAAISLVTIVPFSGVPTSSTHHAVDLLASPLVLPERAFVTGVFESPRVLRSESRGFDSRRLNLGRLILRGSPEVRPARAVSPAERGAPRADAPGVAALESFHHAASTLPGAVISASPLGDEFSVAFSAEEARSAGPLEGTASSIRISPDGSTVTLVFDLYAASGTCSVRYVIEEARVYYECILLTCSLCVMQTNELPSGAIEVVKSI